MAIPRIHPVYSTPTFSAPDPDFVNDKLKAEENIICRNTTVPLPNVLACYTHGPIDRDLDDYGSLFDTYIFMDFVDGQTLDSVWASYSEATKADTSHLKSYMEDIRSIREDAEYIGSANHGPVTNITLENYHDKGSGI
ncbi:hypothetical protein UA08_07748 [Talaromyces atroroseus]|uniref:Uncharacterized protein n=1 Tax=Talaromyces atroroseus TaxID=1441469 RepID=A0A225ATV6_TALAT|nr:hypothetical protein UA08_07748 [Talaromyces atroroseus]OKL56907.1 hypothetical protein UA08_07748 [Talaromyces atroroseus]